MSSTNNFHNTLAARRGQTLPPLTEPRPMGLAALFYEDQVRPSYEEIHAKELLVLNTVDAAGRTFDNALSRLPSYAALPAQLRQQNKTIMGWITAMHLHNGVMVAASLPLKANMKKLREEAADYSNAQTGLTLDRPDDFIDALMVSRIALSHHDACILAGERLNWPTSAQQLDLMVRHCDPAMGGGSCNPVVEAARQVHVAGLEALPFNCLNPSTVSVSADADAPLQAGDDDEGGVPVACPICLDDFAPQEDEGEGPARLFDGHVFGEDCIRRHLSTVNNKCPLCRRIVWGVRPTRRRGFVWTAFGLDQFEETP